MGDSIKRAILEYSLIIVFGKISPNSNIVSAIGIKTNPCGKFKVPLDIICIKYRVKKEEARMLERLVPINETVRNFDLFSMINFVRLPNLYFCLTQTSICNFLAEIRAISLAENKTEKKRPIIPKFSSNI